VCQQVAANTNCTSKQRRRIIINNLMNNLGSLPAAV
jgi:hypothetical protein